MRWGALFAATLIAVRQAPAAAADLERGKLLYSARCVGCHDQSVHDRAARPAR